MLVRRWLMRAFDHSRGVIVETNLRNQANYEEEREAEPMNLQVPRHTELRHSTTNRGSRSLGDAHAGKRHLSRLKSENSVPIGTNRLEESEHIGCSASESPENR